MLNKTDLVTLITPDDLVIGAMDKIEAHRGLGKLHRAISVFLFRSNPKTGAVELLVQRRSDKKIVGALQWANTVCGNVFPGETYLECAKRRLNEELGITQVGLAENGSESLVPVGKFQYAVRCSSEFSENELDQVFASWYNGTVIPNSEEVLDYKWIDWQQFFGARPSFGITTDVQRKQWVPWLKVMLQNPKVALGLEKFVCTDWKNICNKN